MNELRKATHNNGNNTTRNSLLNPKILNQFGDNCADVNKFKTEIMSIRIICSDVKWIQRLQAEQDRQCIRTHNIEVRLSNQCYSGTVISIKYLDCGLLPLGI